MFGRGWLTGRKGKCYQFCVNRPGCGSNADAFSCFTTFELEVTKFGWYGWLLVISTPFFN